MKFPPGGDVQWILLTIEASDGSSFAQAWFDVFNGAKGKTNTGGGGIVADYGIESISDGNRLAIRYSLNATPDGDHVSTISSAVSDGSGARVANGGFLIRNFQLSAERVSFQDNDGVAALDNWAFGGDPAARLYLHYDKDQVWYACDNSAGTSATQFTPNIGQPLLGGVPYSMRVIWYCRGEARLRRGAGTNTPPYSTLPAEPAEGSTVGQLSTGDAFAFQIGVAAGAIAFVRRPEVVEGPTFFDLDITGSDRYLTRSLAGVGRLSEPDVTNKCENCNVAPVETLGISPDAAWATHEVVRRQDLSVEVKGGLDAIDPGGTINSVYHSISNATGTIAIAGQVGSTVSHNASGWNYTVRGDFGFGTTGAANVVATLGEWNRTANVTDPAASTDTAVAFFSQASEIYWFGNQLTEGSRLRSLIPVAGSPRMKHADKAWAPLADVRISDVTRHWSGGLTIVDEWDTESVNRDFACAWIMYGSTIDNNRVEVASADGANVTNGHLLVRTNGTTSTTTPATSIVGRKVQQAALKEGDQQYWIDAISQGALTASLPSDIDRIMFGDSRPKRAIETAFKNDSPCGT